jgi:hypothetical protein
LFVGGGCLVIGFGLSDKNIKIFIFCAVFPLILWGFVF